MSAQRFLVIGSNSFTGSHFVRHLLDKGLEVVGVSRSDEPAEVFLPHRWGPCEGFRFHRINLNHDLDSLMEVVEAQGSTHVVNFAGQGMVAQSWDRPTDWYQTNVVAQVGLHDRLRRVPTLEKYVHVSTPEVYGSVDGPMVEGAAFAPTTPYAVSRAACDMHLQTFFEAYDFPVVFTRAANLYGPGQRLYRIVPRAMLCLRLGQRLPLHGGGLSLRNFVHVVDVASATLKVAVDGEHGEAYHVAGREVVSIRDLVYRIFRLAGVDPRDLVDEVPDRMGKDHRYELDSGKVRNDLGWVDEITLDEGLVDTMRWLDVNLETLSQVSVEYSHKP